MRQSSIIYPNALGPTPPNRSMLFVLMCYSDDFKRFSCDDIFSDLCLFSANLQAFCTNEAQGLTKAISKKLRKPQGGTKGSASRIKSRDWRHGISPKAVDLVEQVFICL